jgi:hypothetical protein
MVPAIKNIHLLVFLLFLAKYGNAQLKVHSSNGLSYVLFENGISRYVSKNTSQRSFKRRCVWDVQPYETYRFNLLSFQGSFLVSSLGFICRQELKLDKLTHIPIRFRLGSLDYVNWMEQKPNAIKPGK